MTSLLGILAASFLSYTGSDDPVLDHQFALVKKESCTEQKVNTSSQEPKPNPPCFSNLFVQGQAAEVPVAPSAKLGPLGAVQELKIDMASPGFLETPQIVKFTGSFESFAPLNQLKGFDKVISLRLENKSAADILKALAKYNVSFVVKNDSLPKEKVTLNLVDVPLSEALESIGDALGGHWDVRGKTLTFRSHQNMSWSPFPQGAMAPLHGFAAPAAIAKLEERIAPMQERLAQDKAMQGRVMEKLAVVEKRLDGTMKSLERVHLADDIFGDGKQDPEKFLKSLTDGQKKMLKEAGHLHFKDLTKEQMGFLNIKKLPAPEMKLMITFSVDKETVTIKN
jgi:hypothetical protein